MFIQQVVIFVQCCLYCVPSLCCFVFQEIVQEEMFDLIDEGTRRQSEPTESQYPHVKKSLQQGEGRLSHSRAVFGWHWWCRLEMLLMKTEVNVRSHSSAPDIRECFVISSVVTLGSKHSFAQTQLQFLLMLQQRGGAMRRGKGGKTHPLYMSCIWVWCITQEISCRFSYTIISCVCFASILCNNNPIGFCWSQSS